ncbi:MAG: hypothetical protein WAK94_01150 [Steroidobacteraceae bacterium]
MRVEITSQEAAEERRLWADFYEATMRAVEIIRSEGTNGNAVKRIVAEHTAASDAVARIKEIRGLP